MVAPRKYRSISPKRLRQLLRYDPDTGVFTWLVKRKGAPYGYIPAGMEAGSVWANGYRCICVEGLVYPASRLAFLWMTGRLPRFEMDHENGDRTDDRWSNLREATHSQNQRNKGVSANNRLGVKGVCYEPSRDRYKAYIEVGGRTVNLGRFKTIEEAKAAYDAAAKKYFRKFARS